MKKNAVKLILVVALIGIFSFVSNAQTISVSSSIEKSSIKRGKTGKGSIILSIPKELHINSNKPTSEFMIPTEIELSSKEAKNLKAIYPKGKNLKFEFSEEAINVYEGKTMIPITFSIPKSLKSKMINIRALVTYQACSNEVCYPPQKKEIVLKALVK
ncbi:MAG: hypothetical protein HC846_08625 [Blastocatellia bacterium]|nr:hypothetical protein [Blastocatellia bacterium]